MAKYVMVSEQDFKHKEQEYLKHYRVVGKRPKTKQYILQRRRNSKPYPAKVSIDIETTTEPALVIYDELAPAEKEIYDSYEQWKTDKPADESKYKTIEESINGFGGKIYYITSYDEETTPEPSAEPEYPDGWYEVTIIRAYYSAKITKYVITVETSDGLQGVVYDSCPDTHFPDFDELHPIKNIGLQGKVYLRNILVDNKPGFKFSLTDK